MMHTKKAVLLTTEVTSVRRLIIKSVKETDTAIVLQQPEIPDIENVKYTIDCQKIQEKYEELLSDVKLKGKNGVLELLPKTVEKMEYNFRKSKQKCKVRNVTENYPEMVIDYGKEEVLLNDVPLDLHPADEDVKKDIDNLLEVFENFNGFIGDAEKLKETHFKIMNAIFVSPFNAKFRCAAKMRDVDAGAPLYMLVSSRTANCGKTFMISVALKMMTGKNLTVFNKADLKKDDINKMQVGCKGVPVFIDEMDSKAFPHMQDMIKNPQRCENNQIETMPMVIFASNNILEPDEPLRRRMVFFRLDGRLPSSVDQNAYNNMGHALKRKFGTGFYREYLRRMLEASSNELEYIMTEKNLPDDYYPDLMKMSSDTIISVFEDYGYDIPSYIHPLTWCDDYSANAGHISEDAVESIVKMYDQNRKAFTVGSEIITIELGNSSDMKKKCESWVNTLPAEVDAKMVPLRDCIRVTLLRKEFEQCSNRKFRRSLRRR